LSTGGLDFVHERRARRLDKIPHGHGRTGAGKGQRRRAADTICPAGNHCYTVGKIDAHSITLTYNTESMPAAAIPYDSLAWRPTDC